MKRREFLAASGAAALASGIGLPARAQQGSVRQGYQTNMWGMPTYYLLRSGALEKHGIKAEEFAVPSGNITMQQMVGRQVDLGTYAGPSFIIGHARGQLVAIAQIEEVGKTVRVMARKDLNAKQVADLRGRKIANQTGSSIANVFVDQIAPRAGLKKADWQEVRMNVNDMVAAMAAKTIDAMVNVEPYNAIAEADGLATTVMNYWDVDRMPVFMAATPEFVDRAPSCWSPTSRAGLPWPTDFKHNHQKVSDTIYAFYTSQGLQDGAANLRQGGVADRGEPRLPAGGELATCASRPRCCCARRRSRRCPTGRRPCAPSSCRRRRDSGRPDVEVAVIGTGWCGGIRAETLAAHPLVKGLHLAEMRAERLKRWRRRRARRPRPPTTGSSSSEGNRRGLHLGHAGEPALPDGEGVPR